MVLQSGNAPYDYSVGDPLRTVNPYNSNYMVGGSGIFLEQAQFVITAEVRKFNFGVGPDFLPDFFVYVNPVIAPSGPYEPKTNGSTLGNLLNPGNMTIINHILDTRAALDLLFDMYAVEGECTADEHRLDWLNQIAPELPLPSGYRRRDPDITEYPFLATTDVHTLGGSGVLFDLDFAEVMFNPYPFFANNVFRDIQDAGTFRIVNGPAWPGFQRTDGSLISLNGREPGTTEGISSEFDFSHIASNEVRLDGYVFLPETDYLIGHGLRNFVIDGNFTYVSSDTRAIFNGDLLPTTRVFASTQALASGIYKLCARNRKAAVPFTTVVSGIVSQWPPSGQAYPAIGDLPLQHAFDVLTPFNIRSVWYNNQEYEHGYQVFDDSFWIIDHADGDRAPSGLAVASPFTGHAFWLRFADLTRSTGSGVFGGFIGSAGSWGEHVGLEKVDDVIYRVQRLQAPGSDSAHHTGLIQKYNSNLDYLGQIETADTEPDPESYTDMTFIPTASVTDDEWMLYGSDGGSRLLVTFYNLDFTVSLGSSNAFYIGALNTGAGNALTQSTVIMGAAEFEGVVRSAAEFSDGNNSTGFTSRGSGIWDLEIGTPGSGVIFKNCRIIDMSKITKQFSSSLEAKIYDLYTVPDSATHTKAGFYALVSWGVTTHRLFLLRLVSRDDATAPGFCVGFWDIVAAYDLGTLPSDVSVTINNVPNMIYQEID